MKTDLNQLKLILAQDDLFAYIYDARHGSHSKKMRDYLDKLYAQVSADYNLHPDNDWADVIAIMVDKLENIKYV